MDRRLARLNMSCGIAMFMMLVALLGSTFVWAAIYLHSAN